MSLSHTQQKLDLSCFLCLFFSLRKPIARSSQHSVSSLLHVSNSRPVGQMCPPSHFIRPAKVLKVHDCLNPSPPIHSKSLCCAFIKPHGNHSVPSHTKCVFEHSSSDHDSGYGCSIGSRQDCKLSDNSGGFACICRIK